MLKDATMEWMTVSDAAAWIGVVRSRVHKLIQDGVIRSTQFGPKMRVVSVADVKTYAATQQNTGRPRTKRQVIPKRFRTA